MGKPLKQFLLQNSNPHKTKLQDLTYEGKVLEPKASGGPWQKSQQIYLVTVSYIKIGVRIYFRGSICVQHSQRTERNRTRGSLDSVRTNFENGIFVIPDIP